MNFIKNKKNILISMLCFLLLFCAWLIYTDTYKRLSLFQEKCITIGVFSDSYWEVQNGYSYQILEDAIAIFEKEHTGVKVDYVSGILKKDYSEWLVEQLLSENAPDVFFVLAEDFNDIAEVGAIKDLTSFIAEDNSFQKERFYSSAYQYGQYHGIQYSLPYECAPKLMFVNQTILDKEGISIFPEKWTWQEFYDICQKVTKDTNGDGRIDQFGAVGYTWKEAFDSNGIQLFNQDGTKCYLTDDNVEQALIFIEQLQQLNKGYTTSSNDFDLGNVAFQPMLFSEYRAYKPYPLSIKKYSGFEWGCIPMPAGPNGNHISTLDTLLIAMNANTKNTQYAWDFMKTLTCNVQIQSEFFQYSEGVSVLKEVTESDKTLQSLIESSENSLNLQILSDALENAVVSPRFRNYDEAISEVDRAVHSIIEENTNISMGQIIWNRKINNKLNQK